MLSFGVHYVVAHWSQQGIFLLIVCASTMLPEPKNLILSIADSRTCSRNNEHLACHPKRCTYSIIGYLGFGFQSNCGAGLEEVYGYWAFGPLASHTLTRTEFTFKAEMLLANYSAITVQMTEPFFLNDLRVGSFPLTVTATTMGYRIYKSPPNKAPLRTVTGRGNDSTFGYFAGGAPQSSYGPPYARVPNRPPILSNLPHDNKNKCNPNT